MTKKQHLHTTNNCFGSQMGPETHFPSSDSSDYVYHSYGHYPASNLPYSSYSPSFVSPYAGQATYGPETHISNSYHLTNHSSVHSSHASGPSHFSAYHHGHKGRVMELAAMYHHLPIESQDSYMDESTSSEPICPGLEGFPNVQEFDELMEGYIEDLSAKKRDKALIHAKRAKNIKMVLLDPKDTAIESAQFRFWVKKMFTLQAIDGGMGHESDKIICHEGKPVAIKEKLFKILTRAHEQCQHGGRDKTSQQVRQHYSWIPKELISRFVKICPTCQIRRGGARITPPDSRMSSPHSNITDTQTPMSLSPPQSRRDSLMDRQMPRSQQSTLVHAQEHSLWINSTPGWSNQSNYRHGIGGSAMDPPVGLDGMGPSAKPESEYSGPFVHHRPY